MRAHAIALVVGIAACNNADTSQPSNDLPSKTPPTGPRGHVEIVDAPPTGDVAPIVVGELARAQADHRQLLVYVGASWCEPCTRFHDAAAAGKLDDTFSTLRLLVFDLDRDQARLEAAGYTSELIPLFAEPGADGKADGRQIQGGIKGDGAVAQLTPRLQSLLAPPQ